MWQCSARVSSGIASIELMVAAALLSAALLTVMSVQLSALSINELSVQRFYAVRQLEELSELARISSVGVCAELGLACEVSDVPGARIDQHQFSDLLAHWLAQGNDKLPPGWLPVSSVPDSLSITLPGIESATVIVDRRLGW
jgi:hypothetical protein